MTDATQGATIFVIVSTTGTVGETVSVPVLATRDRALAERRAVEMQRSSALDAIARRNAVPDRMAWLAENPPPPFPQAPEYRWKKDDEAGLEAHRQASESYRLASVAFRKSPEFVAYLKASQAAREAAEAVRRAEAEAHPEVELALAEETFEVHEVPLVEGVWDIATA